MRTQPLARFFSKFLAVYAFVAVFLSGSAWAYLCNEVTATDAHCDEALGDGTCAAGSPTWLDMDLDGDFSDWPCCCTNPDHVDLDYTEDPLLALDCDDEDALQHEGAIWYVDGDEDGFGVSSAADQVVCAWPGVGWTSATLAEDCDDTEALRAPDLVEVCDGLDSDSDGLVDEGVTTTWFPDGDGDGYGEADANGNGYGDTGGQALVLACSLPSGYSTNNGDCDDTDAALSPVTVWCLDSDGDSRGNPDVPQVACDDPSFGTVSYVLDCEDCNDSDASIWEGGQIWYSDADGDSYGNPSYPWTAGNPSCSGRTGYAPNNDDCNDGARLINPAAAEICDTGSVDEDCDGLANDADSSVTGTSTFYHDGDGDTYGDATHTILACLKPSGYVTTSTDCDDSSASTNPAGVETCDGLDNDCDGSVDESGTDAATWYADADGDGFGQLTATLVACNQPTGYVSLTYATDCDDTRATVNPAASERCDSANLDEDCDGKADDADSSVLASTKTTWYQDGDGDGYGVDDSGTNREACDITAGYVAITGDCDDGSASPNPGASERCNGADDDCDGYTDESDATEAATWYLDYDADGYGVTTTTRLACSRPSGYAATGDDCDDRDVGTYRGATEQCDGKDNDCNGVIDNDVSYANYWYFDADGDSYGSPTYFTQDCTAPVGYVGNNRDCDDYNASIHPGATEYCDGADWDCDSDGYDSDASDAPTWYKDKDGDGYGGSTTTTTACGGFQPVGYVDNNDDCDDFKAAINPDTWWYPDFDSDTYGDGAADALSDDPPVQTCSQPYSHYVSNGSDCNDEDSTLNPKTKWYQDSDTDGFGTPDVSLTQCAQPTGYVRDYTDCNDSSAVANPATLEVCDGIDNDCDSTADEDNATDAITWYRDTDNDGYGNSTKPTVACYQPSGYVADATDCNDSAAGTWPGAVEYCDAVDTDCDSVLDENDAVDASTWYLDADGDGFGAIQGLNDAAYNTIACLQPSGYVADKTDCNDGVAAIFPGAEEIWYDGTDQNCGGESDFDADRDGYDADIYVVDGVQGLDCDDTKPIINPDGTEIWYDGIDEDCNYASDYDADVDGYDSAAFGGFDCVDIQADLDALDPYHKLLNIGTVVGYSADDYTPATISPAAVDRCEPYGFPQIDNDCDGNANTDSSVYLVNTTGDKYFFDEDGDGFADLAKEYCLCKPQDGFYTSYGDCDDDEADIYPNAQETCNNKDDDCDGRIDESTPGAEPLGCITMYADVDEDGFGSLSRGLCLCNSSAECDDDAMLSEYYVNSQGDG